MIEPLRIKVFHENEAFFVGSESNSNNDYYHWISVELLPVEDKEWKARKESLLKYAKKISNYEFQLHTVDVKLDDRKYRGMFCYPILGGSR